jgi:2-oxoisovalerate dehydrogenase E1 component
MEDVFFPQPGWILDAINDRILPLEGSRGDDERDERWATSVRRNRLGV